MRATLLALPCVLLLGLLGQARAGDLWIIAHPDITLSRADIKEVYLGEKQFGGSIKLHPVDNPASQQAFLSTVLGMTAARYRSSWLRKSFRDALNPPAELSGDAAVLDFVQRTPGAVGYVTMQPVGVAVIEKY